MASTLLLADPPARERDSVGFRQPPANADAEQALLGALLVNNDALFQVGDALQPEHFHEPVHQRIYDAILKFHGRGQIANPITLKHYFEQDEALTAAGGAQYLTRLAAAAVAVINIADYAQAIVDLALKRQLITIGEQIVNEAYAHDIDTPAREQIEGAEQRLFGLSSEGSRERGFQPIRHSLVAAIQHAENAIRQEGMAGVPTNLIDMDKLLGGLQKSDLVILAGRPSMGKTALATNIAYNASVTFQKEAEASEKPRRCVGFFSLEMSAEQLATRILSSASQLNADKIFKGRLTNDEFATLVRESNKLYELPFQIDDTPALSIAALRTRARRLKRTHNLGLIVVDYLQLIRASASLNMNNRVIEVSEITQGLKAIAKELEIPVLALSQLSRQVEQRDDKRPQLSDLRESGSIEQDADVVMFIFREEYYLARKEPNIEKAEEYAKWQQDMERAHNLTEVIVAKHRNGPIGNVKLRFDPSFTTFRDFIADDHTPVRYG